MRIAVCGTHGTGKTTLVEALSPHLSGYDVIDEPYRQLEDEGEDFAERPVADDFARQLERAINCLEESGADSLFDRCPADLLGYLDAVDDADSVDLQAWIDRARAAMARLDLVVFVGIEQPDRIDSAGLHFRRLRREVDDRLRDIVLDDRWSFGVPAIEVTGSTEDRVAQVLRHLARHPGR
jgi:GTPase SAR1 family protein